MSVTEQLVDPAEATMHCSAHCGILLMSMPTEDESVVPSASARLAAAAAKARKACMVGKGTEGDD